MRRKVYRSLDQTASFFGIRGRFILVTLIGAGIVLVPSLIIGSATTVLLGGGVFLIGAASVYLMTLSLQSRVSEKDFWKAVARRAYPAVYRVRPKHIRNLWRGFNLPAGDDRR